MGADCVTGCDGAAVCAHAGINMQHNPKTAPAAVPQNLIARLPYLLESGAVWLCGVASCGVA